MTAWTPIVRKCFDAAGLRSYLATAKFTNFKPQFVTVHNTDAPNLAQYASHWARKSPITDEQWMDNLVNEYKNNQGWHSGPHFFITPRAEKPFLAFTPVNVAGTHTPSWNGIALGMEMVGNFDNDPFNGQIQANAITALATIHDVLKLDPAKLRLHKEDPRTTHRNCPGKHVVKADLIKAVQAAIVAFHKPPIA